MLNKYKVRLVKRYDFELDGKDEESVKEQSYYILTREDLLNEPSVKKTVWVKVKKIKKEGKENI